MCSISDQTKKTISFDFRYKPQREFYSIKTKYFFSLPLWRMERGSFFLVRLETLVYAEGRIGMGLAS